MSSSARAAAPAAAAGAATAASRRPLRFLTCGSVDDGKSTLIGRLLWDSKAVKEDQAASLARDGAGGANGQNSLGLPDFALLLDGLQAEREQGITIDVAYRYFSTGRRSFIVADTPGHEQYTRNMATGASTADVAVILVDARHGILEQTRRHAGIAALMGIRHLILAVNKIDLTGYARPGFEAIETAFRELALRHGITGIVAIPVSALRGENVVRRASQAMPWYSGPTLVEALEAAPARSANAGAFRFPVQRVARPHEGFRGYQGTIAGGGIAVGDEVAVLPSGERAGIEAILTFDGELERAFAGDAVTLALDRQLDIARGDMLAGAGDPPLVGRGFEARVIALGGNGLTPWRRYWLKTAGRLQRVTATPLTALDLESGSWQPADRLPVNAMGTVALKFDEAAIFDRYEDNRDTGAFILIDPDSNNTVAGGMVVAASSPVAARRGEGEEGTVVFSLPSRLADALMADEAFARYRDHVTVMRVPHEETDSTPDS